MGLLYFAVLVCGHEYLSLDCEPFRKGKIRCRRCGKDVEISRFGKVYANLKRFRKSRFF